MLLLPSTTWDQTPATPCHAQTHNTAVYFCQPSHCGEPQRTQPGSHACTSDPSATAAPSAPVPKDLDTMLVLCALIPRIPTLLPLCVQVHQTRHQEEFIVARIYPRKQKRRTGGPQQPCPCLHGTPIALATTATRRDSVWLPKDSRHGFCWHGTADRAAWVPPHWGGSGIGDGALHPASTLPPSSRKASPKGCRVL